MTAEVILMNKSAVAVAADRAATTYGRGRTKISETEKIYTLGDDVPVVVMIYGGAELLDHPWQSLIDMYRSQRKDLVLDRVEDYADDFFRFLESNMALFPADRQLEDYAFIIQQIYATIVHQARMLIEVAASSGKRDVNQAQALKAAIVEMHRGYRVNMDGSERADLDVYSDLRMERLFKDHQDVIDTIIKSVFRKRNILGDDRVVLMLRQIACFAMLKNRFEEMHSGVVFAGFGKKEMYPVSVEYLVSTVFANRLKKFRKDVAKVAPGTLPARVLLFADADATFSFVTGIDEEVFDLIMSFSEYLFEELPDGLMDEMRVPGETKPAVRGFISEAFSPTYHAMMYDGVEKYIHDHRLVPLHEVVASTGNQELVERAADFVRLNILQKQVRNEEMTVGGGVDAVLITRAKGVEFQPRTVGPV